MASGYIAFYYPNQKESGSAFQFSIWKTRRGFPAVRLEAAQQNAPKPAAGSDASCFDWQNKAAFQIDAGECGKLGAYIRGFNRDDKFPVLFHSTENKEGQKVTSKFTIKAPVKGDQRNPKQNWLLSLEVKRGDEQFRASAYVHTGEIYQLLWLLDLTICGEMRFAAEQRDKRIQNAVQ